MVGANEDSAKAAPSKSSPSFASICWSAGRTTSHRKMNGQDKTKPRQDQKEDKTRQDKGAVSSFFKSLLLTVQEERGSDCVTIA
jgi:hypothetical protein